MAGNSRSKLKFIFHRRLLAVRLLGIIAVRELSQNQQVAILDRVGFAPKEIAQMLGTTANTVRVALVGIRKDAKQGKRVGIRRKERNDEQS